MMVFKGIKGTGLLRLLAIIMQMKANHIKGTRLLTHTFTVGMKVTLSIIADNTFSIVERACKKSRTRKHGLADGMIAHEVLMLE